MAPTNGAEPIYGTNTLLIGLPTNSVEPFVFDAATSVGLSGRLERLVPLGQAAGDGWAVDLGAPPSTTRRHSYRPA